MSSSILYSHYKNIVEEIFNRWTALKLAVDNGMHIENNGVQACLEIVNYIVDYCLNTNGLHESDLEETLNQIMDQEFDTICEDNSTREISKILLKYKTWLLHEKLPEITDELNALPTCEKWIVDTPKTIIGDSYVSQSKEVDGDSDTSIKSNSMSIQEDSGHTHHTRSR